MNHSEQFFINGAWVDPEAATTVPVINPATELPIGTVAMGNADDVNAAVASAKAAFETFSATSSQDRLQLLDRIITAYEARVAEMADIISNEMGAPLWLAHEQQSPSGIEHIKVAREVLAGFDFEYEIGTSLVRREPIGVCALITPWNWPMGQIASKVAPALAAGCTMVLKPSEYAPLSAILFAEILDEAGVPAGVFNLVNGDGATVGSALATHPDVDMVSFTGSTRAGIAVAHAAAPTVKKVTQELGGKSANIVLEDADLAAVVARDVDYMCLNSGQSCSAPSRMLVPSGRMDEAAAAAKVAADSVRVGDPRSADTRIGPVVSKIQFDRVQRYIETGIAEGANLVAGGPGRPDGLAVGYYVRPTVFSHVTNDMTIARDEIFGPVLVMIGYEDEDDAVRIANDSQYGLSGYVSGSPERAKVVARRIRSGYIHLNGSHGSLFAPFGGFKQSGNGREWGQFGFEEFLETKSLLGYGND